MRKDAVIWRGQKYVFWFDGFDEKNCKCYSIDKSVPISRKNSNGEDVKIYDDFYAKH